MLRSFHRAAFGALADQMRGPSLGERDWSSMEYWARLWQMWALWAFLKEYLAVADGSPFVPRERSELMVLLDALILERALYELGRELGREHGAQPQWTGIALHSIDQILEVEQDLG
jgi:maltose alpha-D-glucosyltransferase / alpha-amylase